MKTTIDRLKERIAATLHSQQTMRRANDAIRQGAGRAELEALGMAPAAAEAFLRPDSLAHHMQLEATAGRVLRGLERQLAQAEARAARRGGAK